MSASGFKTAGFYTSGFLIDDAGGGASTTYSVSGGMSLGGDVIQLLTRSHDVSGGVGFSGQVDATRGFNYLATGGVLVGGSIEPIYCRNYASSGGLAMSGNSPFSTHVSVMQWIASGGISFGGAVAWVASLFGSLRKAVMNIGISLGF